VRSTSLEQSVVDVNKNDNVEDDEDGTTDVINWSGTHKVTVSNANFWEPESVSEVEEIIEECYKQGQTVRPLGSSLSPNGIALNKNGMISMANVDRILDIDTTNNTITVEAGITVSKVRFTVRYCVQYNKTMF
jgi:L-galactono-1,4-lactone dehydrogenase